MQRIFHSKAGIKDSQIQKTFLLNPQMRIINEYGHRASCPCTFCVYERLIHYLIIDIGRGKIHLTPKRTCTICGKHLKNYDGSMTQHKQTHAY